MRNAKLKLVSPHRLFEHLFTRKYDCFQYVCCISFSFVFFLFFFELNFVVLFFVETIGVEPLHWLLWQPKTHKSSIYEVRMQVPFLCICVWCVDAICDCVVCWLCTVSVCCRMVKSLSFSLALSTHQENNGRHMWKEDWSSNAFLFERDRRMTEASKKTHIESSWSFQNLNQKNAIGNSKLFHSNGISCSRPTRKWITLKYLRNSMWRCKIWICFYRFRL